MIDGLIAGRLFAKPIERTTRFKNLFFTAKVRATAKDGEVFFVNIISYDPEVGAYLMAREIGDTVNLGGNLTPKAWKPPKGDLRATLDLFATAILPPQASKRKANLKGME